MSKNRRGFKYDLAYEKVTGRPMKTYTTTTMNIADMLKRLREDNMWICKFVTTKCGYDGGRYWEGRATFSLRGTKETPFFRVWYDPSFTILSENTTVYSHSEDSLCEDQKEFPADTHPLIRRYAGDKHGNNLNMSKLKQNSLQPFQDEDGNTFFLSYRPVKKYEMVQENYFYFYKKTTTLYDIFLFIVHDDTVEVTEEQYDNEELTTYEHNEIRKLLDHNSTKVWKEEEWRRDRPKAKSMLQEIKKIANGGATEEDLYDISAPDCDNYMVDRWYYD